VFRERKKFSVLILFLVLFDRRRTKKIPKESFLHLSFPKKKKKKESNKENQEEKMF
jgi:hypothetical protein